MQAPKREQFCALCGEYAPLNTPPKGIGLLAEKRLHGILKRWIEPDVTRHEQAVTALDGTQTGLVADVLTDGGIFEIQTGKLFPLSRKIPIYFEKTAYDVTVVHPLFFKKHVCWLDPESGELTSRRTSPLHETPLRAIAELRPFLPYVGTPRFSLWLPSLSVEEIRLLDGWGRGGKRGSHRKELVPTDMGEVTVLREVSDYRAFFPVKLRSQTEFTAAEFGKASGLRGRAVYGALAVFEGLFIIEKCGKRGRATLYRLR